MQVGIGWMVFKCQQIASLSENYPQSVIWTIIECGNFGEFLVLEIESVNCSSCIAWFTLSNETPQAPSF